MPVREKDIELSSLRYRINPTMHCYLLHNMSTLKLLHVLRHIKPPTSSTYNPQAEK